MISDYVAWIPDEESRCIVEFYITMDEIHPNPIRKLDPMKQILKDFCDSLVLTH